MPLQTVVLNFQDPTGTPLANGYVTLRLQQDGGTGNAQIAAGRVITVQLDGVGTGIFELWLAGVSPTVVYFAQAYTAFGQPVWRGEITVSTSLASYILLEDGTLIYLESGGPDAILTEM